MRAGAASTAAAGGACARAGATKVQALTAASAAIAVLARPVALVPIREGYHRVLSAPSARPAAGLSRPDPSFLHSAGDGRAYHARRSTVMKQASKHKHAPVKHGRPDSGEAFLPDPGDGPARVKD